MKPTPVMSQYLRLKEEAGDAILFFRMGDFYEMFMEDAVEAAELLDLTLTSRDKQDPDPVPMAGVPWHSAAPYITRLLKAGRRVALCEQIERPGNRKLMEREIVEILTPGTAVTEELLEEGENLFLGALFAPGGDKPWGIAVADISTGEFSLGEFPAAAALAELGRLNPRELLLPTGLDESDEVRSFIKENPELFTTKSDEWLFSPSRGRELLLEHFGVATLEPFGVADLPGGLAAAGALLSYARDQRRSSLEHLRPPRALREGQSVQLDETTLRNLEILAPISGRGRHCLLAVLDATRTAMGARTLRRALSRPLLDLEAIHARHAAVQLLTERPDALEDIREKLGRVADLERLIGRFHCGRGRPQDLGRLRDSLLTMPSIVGTVRELAHHGFFPLPDGLDPLQGLGDELDRALNDTARLAAGGEFIRDGYDDSLDELRGLTRNGEQRIAAIQEQERQATGIPSLKVAYNRVFGYFIEVTRSQLERVPSHYQRKQTLVGAERYVTPELKEWEEKITAAQDQVQQRQQELLDRLQEGVRSKTEKIQTLAEALGEWDLLGSLAIRAIEHGYVRPLVDNGDRIHIRDGRHPVVERFLERETFVPNDIDLDTRGRQIQIITGPNMAGKSTYLRQMGLLVLMAQAGSFVPAAEARIGVVDQVFTRVGATDNIARGQSTFLVEMVETSRILHGATSRSLVLLDEIGRGTSTFDGLAIAWAVAEHLRVDPLRRARTLFATHFHELTALARREPGYINLNVVVKEWKEKIVFVRRVVEGAADRSYGIQVARLAGLPGSLLDRAREILHVLEEHGPDNLDELAPERVDGRPQMTLFQGGGVAESPAPRSGPEAELLKALRNLDLDQVSGLEALQWLSEWKRRMDDAQQE